MTKRAADVLNDMLQAAGAVLALLIAILVVAIMADLNENMMPGPDLTNLQMQH